MEDLFVDASVMDLSELDMDVSDVSLGGRKTVVINPYETNSSFGYHNGIASISDSHESDYWEPLLFKSKNITSVYLDGIQHQMLLRTPSNIHTILVEDIGHITKSWEWLIGRERGINHKNMTIKYTGARIDTDKEYTPERVSPDIVQLLLPCRHDVGSIIHDNPHLNKIGVDLDTVHVTEFPIPMMIWSSNPHRSRLISSLSDAIEIARYA